MNSNLVDIKCGKITFQLKKNEDFEWLNKLGEAFCIFDQQDSGNICFGIINTTGNKFFVKYAGAYTTEFNGNPIDAVTRLKNAIPNYFVLQHDKLIKLHEHFSTTNGYAAVFEWFDGECLFDHWNFDKYPRCTHPKSTYYRFHQLTISKRLKCLEDIYQFHVNVEEEMYQAVDFYDGSILYNFDLDEMKICDIDFYSKKPYINTLCWGSNRFNSPEDFKQGEILDERTNVYNMGATAFALIGGELDRKISAWEGSEGQFKVAQTAINDSKLERYSSVKEFYNEWKKASN